METDHDAFRAAIDANPTDQAPWGAYADYLDEQGMGRHARAARWVAGEIARGDHTHFIRGGQSTMSLHAWGGSPVRPTQFIDEVAGHLPEHPGHVRLDMDGLGQPYLTHADGRSQWFDSDWSHAGLASSFGWQACPHGDTDGTVDCPHRKVGDMLSEAHDYLRAHAGDEIEDPGYFDRGERLRRRGMTVRLRRAAGRVRLSRDVEALHRAVAEKPLDRAGWFVLADALSEAGKPWAAHAMRKVATGKEEYGTLLHRNGPSVRPTDPPLWTDGHVAGIPMTLESGTDGRWRLWTYGPGRKDGFRAFGHLDPYHGQGLLHEMEAENGVIEQIQHARQLNALRAQYPIAPDARQHGIGMGRAGEPVRLGRDDLDAIWRGIDHLETHRDPQAWAALSDSLKENGFDATAELAQLLAGNCVLNLGGGQWRGTRHSYVHSVGMRGRGVGEFEGTAGPVRVRGYRQNGEPPTWDVIFAGQPFDDHDGEKIDWRGTAVVGHDLGTRLAAELKSSEPGSEKMRMATRLRRAVHFTVPDEYGPRPEHPPLASGWLAPSGKFHQLADAEQHHGHWAADFLGVGDPGRAFDHLHKRGWVRISHPGRLGATAWQLTTASLCKPGVRDNVVGWLHSLDPHEPVHLGDDSWANYRGGAHEVARKLFEGGERFRRGGPVRMAASDIPALVAASQANSQDHAHALILADALEETGRSAHARVIRAHSTARASNPNAHATRHTGSGTMRRLREASGLGDLIRFAVLHPGRFLASRKPNNRVSLFSAMPATRTKKGAVSKRWQPRLAAWQFEGASAEEADAMFAELQREGAIGIHGSTLDATNWPERGIGDQPRNLRLRRAVRLAARKDRPTSLGTASTMAASGNQQTLLQTLKVVLDRSGLSPNKVYPAVHDVGGQARASAVAAVFGEQRQGAGEYGAAWEGLVAKQPNLVVFRSHPQGPDSVYRFAFRGPQAAMSGLLDRVGVQNRVYVPHGDVTHVFLYDQGRALRRAVGQLAVRLGLTAVEHTGEGKQVGGGDDMGRGAYRDEVRRAEAGPVRQRRAVKMATPYSGSIHWQALNNWLGRRSEKLAGNNRRIRRLADGDLAVRLHNTDVVIVHQDGTYTLNWGNYHTRTTDAAIGQFAPVNVRSWGNHEDDWIFNGVRVTAGGTPLHYAMATTDPAASERVGTLMVAAQHDRDTYHENHQPNVHRLQAHLNLHYHRLGANNPEEQPFHARIRENEDDAAPWGVYADWLTEHGREGEATSIRRGFPPERFQLARAGRPRMIAERIRGAIRMAKGTLPEEVYDPWLRQRVRENLTKKFGYVPDKAGMAQIDTKPLTRIAVRQAGSVEKATELLHNLADPEHNVYKLYDPEKHPDFAKRLFGHMSAAPFWDQTANQPKARNREATETQLGYVPGGDEAAMSVFDDSRVRQTVGPREAAEAGAPRLPAWRRRVEAIRANTDIHPGLVMEHAGLKPGIGFAQMTQKTKLTSAQVRAAVDRLVREGKLASVRQPTYKANGVGHGFATRLWPAGHPDIPAGGPKTAMDAVAEHLKAGKSITEAARLLGVTQQSAHEAYTAAKRHGVLGPDFEPVKSPPGFASKVDPEEVLRHRQAGLSNPEIGARVGAGMGAVANAIRKLRAAGRLARAGTPVRLGDINDLAAVWHGIASGQTHHDPAAWASLSDLLRGAGHEAAGDAAGRLSLPESTWEPMAGHLEDQGYRRHDPNNEYMHRWIEDPDREYVRGHAGPVPISLEPLRGLGGNHEQKAWFARIGFRQPELPLARGVTMLDHDAGQRLAADLIVANSHPERMSKQTEWTPTPQSSWIEAVGRLPGGGAAMETKTGKEYDFPRLSQGKRKQWAQARSPGGWYNKFLRARRTTGG